MTINQHSFNRNMTNRIQHEDITEDFWAAWKHAMAYLVTYLKILEMKGEVTPYVLRRNLNQPFVEHLSFGVGNGIFFVWVEMYDHIFDSSRKYFLEHARNCGAVPCIMPLEEKDGEWQPIENSILIDAYTRKPLYPLSLITDEVIEMTDWEVSDFAIDVVVKYIIKEYQIEDLEQDLKFQSTPGSNPQIWFVDRNSKRNFVIVRAVRYPQEKAKRPDNIAQFPSLLGCDQGYFASVSLANIDAFDEAEHLPPSSKYLYRGCGMYVRFIGLEEITT